jgi:sulfite reductase (NADPH) hemoprotein beta-component
VIEAIAGRFVTPPFATLPRRSLRMETAKLRDASFARWLATNTHPHREPGYISAIVSLKPAGGIPGDASADQMDAVAELADRYSFGDIRVTHEQNLVLPHVRQDDLHDLWAALGEIGLATANVNLITDIIACPGLDYCALATARSIPVAQRISERFADLDRQHDIGELHLNISGCINACGHHHIAHIGILGVDKGGEEYYQITLGGAGDDKAAIGTIIGPAVSSADVVDAVETILDTYLGLRRDGERFIDAFRRTGIGPFKEAVFATHQ